MFLKSNSVYNFILSSNFWCLNLMCPQNRHVKCQGYSSTLNLLMDYRLSTFVAIQWANTEMLSLLELISFSEIMSHIPFPHPTNHIKMMMKKRWFVFGSVLLGRMWQGMTGSCHIWIFVHVLFTLCMCVMCVCEFWNRAW